MPSRAEDLFAYLKEMKTETERTAYVEAWVRPDGNGQRESEYLDFKNISTKDNENAESWSKLLASFANNEGGVVVWGIDARRPKNTTPGERPVDCAVELRPLAKPAQYSQFLRDIVRDSINEPIHGIDHLEVAASSGTGGYVVSLVPRGKNQPYRAMKAENQPYLQRIGDRNELISNNLLRSMFYPHLTPRLRFRLRINDARQIGQQSVLKFLIDVRNLGVSTASDMVMKIESSRRWYSVSPESQFFEWPDEIVQTENREAKLGAKHPLHPGTAAKVIQLAFDMGQYMGFTNVTLVIDVFMANQESCRFSRTISESDLMSPGTTIEFEQVEPVEPQL